MQYLFLDESGNLHKNSPDRYFVIGGIYTNNYSDIKKSYVEINRELKEKLNMDFETELKAAYLNMEEKMDIVVKLQKMNGMYIVGIIVDKEKIGIEIDEIHLYYNYIIRKLLDYLIKIGLIKTNIGEELYLNIDKSSMKIEDINSLENYLKTHFNIERNMKYKINVSYWDSKKNYMVQVADIMCNTIWNIAQSPKSQRLFRHLNKNKRLRIYRLYKIN
ncbi:MAG: DUF3800 domain-containing protein [Clostridia bacterium]